MELTMEWKEFDERFRAALPELERQGWLRTKRKSLFGAAVERVYARWHLFADMGVKFEHWFGLVARNLKTDRERRQARHPEEELDEAAHAGHPLTPEEVVGSRERDLRVRLAFAKLDPRDREVLELSVGLSDDEARSQEEVARLLGLPGREQARRAIDKAKAALRALVPDDLRS